MAKTILITGSTDGIGFATAETLLAEGCHVIIHGRTSEKVNGTVTKLAQAFSSQRVSGVMADLSDLNAVKMLAHKICQQYDQIDVLINNAGVFKTQNPVTPSGHDLRFIVNTIAPYLLTRELKPLLKAGSRVVNLSSAAQSPVDIDALSGKVRFDEDFPAYAQSKLALTAWTAGLANVYSEQGILLVSVNPGSLLATKMVKDGFGVAGNDISQGSDILRRASLSDEFSDKAGQYFDNDTGQFALPHHDALDQNKNQQIINAMDLIIKELT